MTMFVQQQSQISNLNTIEMLNSFLIHNNTRDKVDKKKEIQTKAAQDLFELLHLKKEQIKQYGAVLIPQFNLYIRH